MVKSICTVCGYEYDPSIGDPGNGIAPVTAFEELPDDWSCPVCGVTKGSFESCESKSGESDISMWQCQMSNCGYIYRPEKGDRKGKIPPNTPFEDLPDNWKCPVCGATKKSFKKLS